MWSSSVAALVDCRTEVRRTGCVAPLVAGAPTLHPRRKKQDHGSHQLGLELLQLQTKSTLNPRPVADRIGLHNISPTNHHEYNTGDATSNQPSKDVQDKPDDDSTPITPETRLKTLIGIDPNLPQRLPGIAPEFKMLNSPLGKLMIGKVDVKMMSERSGLPVGLLIKRLQELIRK